jgi:hypothetical protein
MPNYQPKTAWLKQQIANKTRNFRGYNLAEANMQEKQMKYLQRNPIYSPDSRKLQDEIIADISAYRQSQWKERGTPSSAKRVPVK